MNRITWEHVTRIGIVVSVTFAILGAFITFAWAVTDKTAFWNTIGIASTQRVDTVEEMVKGLHGALDSLGVKLDAANEQLAIVKNGRIIDRWVQIKDSPRFSEKDKDRIKDGVFVSKTITADSLGILLRDK